MGPLQARPQAFSAHSSEVAGFWEVHRADSWSKDVPGCLFSPGTWAQALGQVATAPARTDLRSHVLPAFQGSTLRPQSLAFPSRTEGPFCACSNSVVGHTSCPQLHSFLPFRMRNDEENVLGLHRWQRTGSSDLKLLAKRLTFFLDFINKLCEPLAPTGASVPMGNAGLAPTLPHPHQRLHLQSSGKKSPTEFRSPRTFSVATAPLSSSVCMSSSLSCSSVLQIQIGQIPTGSLSSAMLTLSHCQETRGELLKDP